ncbi:Peptidyl-prolyl cis-trans isomerase cyp8 [Ascosphaera acerosa]|nr:Peptidyl-prolyl cis-trans isomerase cyp8 [Ascosphaera acerosa]
MGKGTDKLYITHSEWASEDAYSASAGSNAGASSKQRGSRAAAEHAPFRRLPFNYCALSLQPFKHPVCTPDGTVFDLLHIVPWLKKHGTNPVTGQPLASSDLIKLHFVTQGGAGDVDHAAGGGAEYVDPVTFKPLTSNTHVVAIRTSGNVFAWDTVDKLNVRPKMWRDLVSDDEFTRKDIITLQDPANVGARDLSSFKYLQDGESPAGKPDSTGDINLNAMGNAAKILQAKEAVARARSERNQRAAGATETSSAGSAHTSTTTTTATRQAVQSKSVTGGTTTPYNAARYTTGKAAASFTSTGLTPHTSADLALLTDEQYMLRRGRVKSKGYAQIVTTLGALNLELHAEYAPKAVWNFLRLARKGYYDGVAFHRNIRGFMIQGGDPTGTGRGGQSIWGKNFEDEVDNPLKHDARGTVSMANKGRDTNSSQFFIAYRAVPHLDRKHTIFARLVDSPSPSSSTLDAMEDTPVDAGNRPVEPIKILQVKIFVDPFEEFLQRKEQEEGKRKRGQDGAAAGSVSDSRSSGKHVSDSGNGDDDDIDAATTTWTGKKIGGASRQRGSAAPADGTALVGKYLKTAASTTSTTETAQPDDSEDFEYERERARKKMKARSGGFGNFEGW